MPAVVPVSHEHHRTKRWKPFLDYRFAASQAFVPIVIAEAPRAALSMPIGFVPQGDNFMMVAVLGLKAGENLLVGPDGRWLTPYVPAAVRSYPFALGAADDGREVLCVNEDSGLVVDGAEGEPFYDEAGDPSPAIGRVASFVQQVSTSRTATTKICATLKAHNLIQPWPITLKSETGDRHVEGLWKIDETALNALPEEAFLEVRSAGGLPLVYCQLLSMQHIHFLGQLASVRLGPAAAMATLPVTATGDLDLEFLNADPVAKFRFT